MNRRSFTVEPRLVAYLGIVVIWIGYHQKQDTVRCFFHRTHGHQFFADFPASFYNIATTRYGSTAIVPLMHVS